MHIRRDYEERERQLLAPYAQLSSASLGRQYAEKECIFRPCFYRDVGRIIHSTAFRLLEYKTQVFVNHEGDYYRTRLTHSLEVAQIARGLARILKLNADLAEAISLAHDLGHAPFGHAGEEKLNELMAADGGFEHNLQGFRVVTFLEERYPDFPGLNLSYEVLEGMLKHHTTYDKPMKVEGFKDVGYPTLEAQVVSFADEIAFMNHDLDDGIHWGMLTLDMLREVELWDETYNEVKSEIPCAPTRIIRRRTISEIIDKLINDLQEETQRRIKEHGIKTIDDVRAKGKEIVSFSERNRKKTEQVKEFLFRNVYSHPKVVETSKQSVKIIEDLFNGYLEHPHALPDKFYKRYAVDGSKRHICDYIAGMTDRFAYRMHEKLFDHNSVVW